MPFQSDKFKKATRDNIVPVTGQKKILSFNKFVRFIDRKIRSEKQFEVLAAFDFYDVNCEDCLEQWGTIENMYIMSNEELKLRVAQGEAINVDHASIILKCPKCGDMKRVTDLRRHRGLSTANEPVTSDVGNSHVRAPLNRQRSLLNTEGLPPKINDFLFGRVKNKAKQKELELVVKKHNATFKQYKNSVFRTDIEALISEGKNVLKVDNVNI